MTCNQINYDDDEEQVTKRSRRYTPSYSMDERTDTPASENTVSSLPKFILHGIFKGALNDGEAITMYSDALTTYFSGDEENEEYYAEGEYRYGEIAQKVYDILFERYGDSWQSYESDLLEKLYEYISEIVLC